MDARALERDQDLILMALSAAGIDQGPGLAFLLAPITTGPRELRLMGEVGCSWKVLRAKHHDRWLREVVLPNREDALAAAGVARRVFHDGLVVTTAPIDFPGWPRNGYLKLSRRLVDRASALIAAPDWAYSPGARGQLLAGLHRSLPIYDLAGRAMDIRALRAADREARDSLKAQGWNDKRIASYLQEELDFGALPTRGSQPSDSRLLERIRQLGKEANFESITEVMHRAWSRIRNHRPSPALAETCRLTAQAHVTQGEYDRAAVWRARSLRVAAQSGWINGVAGLLIAEAFRVGVGTGDSKPPEPSPEEAALILEELKPLISDAIPIHGVGLDPETMNRLYHEKRGFFLFQAADYKAAKSAYGKALKYVQGDERGELKVRGGRALCTYLDDPRGKGRRKAITETEKVIEDADKTGWIEIRGVAEWNLKAMRQRTRRVKPYETL